MLNSVLWSKFLDDALRLKAGLIDRSAAFSSRSIEGKRPKLGFLDIALVEPERGGRSSKGKMDSSNELPIGGRS